MTNQEQKDTVAKIFDFSDRIPGPRAKINPLDRAIRMMRQPQTVWPEVSQEAGGVMDALFPYTLVTGLAPMLVGGFLASSIWMLVSLMGGYPMHPAGAIFGAVVEYGYSLVGLLMLSKILELAAPSLNLKQSLVLSVRVLVYASTPAHLMGLVGWIPFLGWFAEIAGLWWSIHLAIQGCKAVLKQIETAEPSKQPDAPACELALR